MISEKSDSCTENRKEGNIKIILDEQRCRGCNSCMLACSFHHHGTFSKEASSIQISWDYVSGKIIWRINPNCDLCEKESECLCIKYCPYEALSVEPTGSSLFCVDSK